MKKKPGAEPKKRGPKSKFCPELLGRVCGRVEEGETVKEAVKLEGMGLSQFYERVGEKPEMAEALRKARMAKGLEILEAEAYRRALEGDVVPVYRKGVSPCIDANMICLTATERLSWEAWLEA